VDEDAVAGLARPAILYKLGVFFLFVVVFDGFLEILNAFPDSFAHFGEPLCAEQDQHDNGEN
jgi:hypothetical protein